MRTLRVRRHRIIVEGFHARFVLVQILWFSILLAVMTGLLFSPTILRLQDADVARRQASAEQFLVLHRVVWPAFAGVLAAAAAVVIAMSHRVAGPLYRFRRIFAEVARGRLSLQVTTRRGDYLAQEAADLDLMLARLRARIREAQGAVDDAAGGLGRISRFGWLPSPEELQRSQAAIERARAALAAFDAEEPEAAGHTAIVSPPAMRERLDREVGFSLVETMIACAMVGILAALAVPRYTSALETARITKGIGDIRTVGNELVATRILRGCVPSLKDAGFGDLRDPWGRAYVMGVIARPGRGRGTGPCLACSGSCIGQEAARKDGRLVPINSDFDLYSAGADGKTAAPLTAGPSRDDIVRANDGAFIGLGRNY